MKLHLAAAGALAGLLVAIIAAGLLAWQLAVIMIGLLVTFVCATQVNVDKPAEGEVLEEENEDLLR